MHVYFNYDEFMSFHLNDDDADDDAKCLLLKVMMICFNKKKNVFNDIKLYKQEMPNVISRYIRMERKHLFKSTFPRQFFPRKI